MESVLSLARPITCFEMGKNTSLAGPTEVGGYKQPLGEAVFKNDVAQKRAMKAANRAHLRAEIGAAIRREVKVMFNPLGVLQDENFAGRAAQYRARKATAHIEDPEERKKQMEDMTKELMADLNPTAIRQQVFATYYHEYASYLRKGKVSRLRVLLFVYDLTSDFRATSLCQKPKGDIYRKYQQALTDKAHAGLIRLILKKARADGTLAQIEREEAAERREKKAKKTKQKEKNGMISSPLWEREVKPVRAHNMTFLLRNNQSKLTA